MNGMDREGLIADRATGALLSALRSGELRDGQFVSMSQLVDQLDFPIAAIRDAVKHASAHGLLTTLPKKGVRVMEARPEIIRECLDFRMALDQEGARRRIGERDLSGLETLRASHLAMRDAARGRSKTARGLSARAIGIDLSLHDFLADGLGNSRLQLAYDVNRIRIGIIQNVRPFVDDRVISAMDEHLAIIDALDRGDVQGATDAIRHHCEQTQRWWGVA